MTLPSSGPLSSTQVTAELLYAGGEPFVMPTGAGMYDLTGKTPFVTGPTSGPPWAGLTLPNDFWGKTYWRYGNFYMSATWENRVYGPPIGVFGIGWTDYTGQLQQPEPTWNSLGQNGNGYYARVTITVYGMMPYNYFDLTVIGGFTGPHVSNTTAPPSGSLGIGGQADADGNSSATFNIPNDNFWYPQLPYPGHLQRFQLWEKNPSNNWVTQGKIFDLSRTWYEGYDYLGTPTQY